MPMETVPLPVPLPLPTLLLVRMPLEPPSPPRLWMERVTPTPILLQPEMMAQLPMPMEIRRPTEMVPLPVPLPLPTLLVRMPLEPPCPPRPWTELEMRAVLPMVLWMTNLPLHLVTP